MKPTEIAKNRESQEQWLVELLSRRQDLSIQMAKLDVEISVETVKAKGVVEGRESSVEDAAGDHSGPNFAGGDLRRSKVSDGRKTKEDNPCEQSQFIDACSEHSDGATRKRDTTESGRPRHRAPTGARPPERKIFGGSYLGHLAINWV
jgi:hypothetical protein